ncbi:MAG: RNA pyrophosphohydrolase [Pseudomonadales bacterium]|nr:RNA pyrophosphohydrolase [Pseudomonadales bacterium]
MIDAEGFRPNVGIIVANRHGDVLWARRTGYDAWQFPQGGIARGESPEEAMFRELDEEVGLRSEYVKVLAQTRGWLRYRLPARFIRPDRQPRCIGQKQKWFLLKLLADTQEIRLDRCQPAEFDAWRWVSFWYPLNQVVSFKREVYRKALKELAPRLTVEEEL